MKVLINKAVFFGVSLVLLLVLFGEGAAGAQKGKAPPVTPQERKAPAAKQQARILSARSEVNPEFVQRLADPKLDPEFARQHPDPAERLQAAQKVADLSCFDFNVSASYGSDAQGCYIDVTAVHTYTFSNATNACTLLPHGIYIEICPGTQITSPPMLTGAWFAGSTSGSSSSGLSMGGNAVWWSKPCPAWNNYSNIIPSGQTLSIRLRVPGFCSGIPCNITVRELTGGAYPNNPASWSCQQLLTIGVDSHGYSIGPDISVCTGDFTKVCLNPAPPSTAQVTWYKYVGTPCPTATCSTLPLSSPWIQDTTVGGVCDPTNILTQATCYVAVVKDGCGYEISNVKKIDVCSGPPSATIVATPATGFPPPTINVPYPPSPCTQLNNVPHACTQWQGQLCLNIPASPCTPTIVGWTVNGQPIANSAGQTCINTGLLKLQPKACCTSYVFQATLANPSNACGNTTVTWQIVIDRPPNPGSTTANPPPPLCYDRSTVLTHKTSCGKVVQWEKREETTPCSGVYPAWPPITPTPPPIPGSQGTSVWWTNDLQKTTQYRVLVANGACPPVYSPVYTVTVKPKLTVTITANQTILCPPGVTLTATSSWGPPSLCNYPVGYQWYLNGAPIPGATGSTYSPTTGGNYYVVVNGKPCGKAKSNVITICDPPKLVITGDCCVCPGKPITLTASLLWKQLSCQGTSCTYKWNPGGATTPTIQVSQPGTYSVTVNCSGCQLSASYKVGACASPAAACVLDPGMTAAGNTFVRRVTLAQTFTPTQNGFLTKITHGLQNNPGGVTSYDLLVTTTAAGLPSWTGGPYNPPNVLFKATGLAVFANSGMVNAVVTIPSGQEPCLTAGTKYALILIPGNPTTGNMQWRGNSSASSYPSGSAYELNGTTWTVPTTGPKNHGFKLDGLCPCP